MPKLRLPLLLSLALLSGVAVHAESTRMIRLNFADASAMASWLGGIAAGGKYSPAVAEDFAHRTIATGLRRMPAGEGQWAWNAEGRSYPNEAGGAILPVPEGITQRPVALMDQNALLVSGSSDALDQVEELVRLLDKPMKMVNIELKLVDQPEEQVDEWGIDFQALNGNATAASNGNASAAGPQLRYGVGDLSALLGVDRRSSRGKNVTGANVTTFDNTPATVSFGETMPFFVSHISYDAFGNRHVDTETDSVFNGIELFVHPRITGNDTVTMRLVPTITEGAGVVTAPDGSNIPIPRSVMTDTTVRVQDGQSLVIGGLSRLSDSQLDSFQSLLGEKRINRTSNPMLIVTPHIIREQ